MFKILALDGGGIRAVFQARLIQRIEEARGGMIKPDMYAGTSGGAIVAASHQLVPANKIIDFFEIEGPKIFKRESFLQEIDDLFNMVRSRYETAPIKKALTEVFGDIALSSLAKPTLITSFALKSTAGYWQPTVFHNFKTAKPTEDLKVVDALLRSTAAPTYFPVYQDHCDGGVWGNNPAMSALAAACDPFVGGQNQEKVSILSLGTGRPPSELVGSKRALGAADWFRRGIIDILKDGNVESSHYYVKSLLGPRYQRIQFTLDPDIRLDDVRGIPDMIDFANLIDLDPILAWMEGFWDQQRKIMV